MILSGQYLMVFPYTRGRTLRGLKAGLGRIVFPPHAGVYRLSTWS